jgi:hypothetical protein
MYTVAADWLGNCRQKAKKEGNFPMDGSSDGHLWQKKRRQIPIGQYKSVLKLEGRQFRNCCRLMFYGAFAVISPSFHVLIFWASIARAENSRNGRNGREGSEGMWMDEIEGMDMEGIEGKEWMELKRRNGNGRNENGRNRREGIEGRE